MTRRRNALDRMAARVMDLESAAYGDERERAVSMESGLFGLTTGLYLGLVGAVVASMVGLVPLSLVLLLTAVLPSVASLWYARRRGVDLVALAENAGARSTMLSTVVVGAGTALTSAAVAYTVATGQPVLPVPSFDVSLSGGFLGGMARGAPVGGVLGGLAAIVAGVLGYRRAHRRG